MSSGARDPRIDTLLESGDPGQALARTEAMLTAAPADEALRELRAALLMQLQRIPEAREALGALVAEGHASVEVLKRFALCEAVGGDFASAAAVNRRVVEMRPGDFVARLDYADCLTNAGDTQRALPEYFRAIHEAQKKGRWLGDDSTAPHLRARVRAAMDVVDAGRQALFEQAIAPQVEAHGRDAMARVETALRLYLGLEQQPLADDRQRPTFFRMPGLPATPYFDRGLFDWYEVLESQTALIGEELAGVLEDGRGLQPFLDLEGVANPEAYLGGPAASRAWDASFFYRHGERYEQAHARCPRTSEALSRVPLTAIEGHAPEVLFSILAPGTHITPHYGVTNTRVVTHLPLIVPEGDCQLVVGGEVHAWRQGRCVTFDDTFLHEAWNRTNERRVVMILDTWNPYLAPEECAAIRALVEAIGAFNLQAGIR